MMAFEVSPDRPTTHRQHVVIDGQRHILLDLRTLEGLGWDVRGSIAYPDPAPGWATTRIGTTRFCAWFEGGRVA